MLFVMIEVHGHFMKMRENGLNFLNSNNMNPRYKWFNKYQPTCKDELEKSISNMDRTLLCLQFKREPDEWLVNMLMSRIAKYKSLLPKQRTENKPSLLYPEFNK